MTNIVFSELILYLKIETVYILFSTHVHLQSVMVRKVRHYLNNIAKSIEKNEERLRIISSTLEHAPVPPATQQLNTLRRRPSPKNSLGGSVSSMNGLNMSNTMQNLSTGSGITSGNNNPNLFGE